jgi:hypothetical protein
LRYQSKLAQAGDNNTTSPGRAAPAARSTASDMDAAVSTGAIPVNTAAMIGAVSPMAMTARMRCGSAASPERSTPLSEPPAMSTT